MRQQQITLSEKPFIFIPHAYLTLGYPVSDPAGVQSLLEQPIPAYSKTASSIDDKTAKDPIGHYLPIPIDSPSSDSFTSFSCSGIGEIRSDIFQIL